MIAGRGQEQRRPQERRTDAGQRFVRVEDRPELGAVFGHKAASVDDVAGDHHIIRLGQKRSIGDGSLFRRVGTAIAEDDETGALVGCFGCAGLCLEDDFTAGVQAVGEALPWLECCQGHVIDAVGLDSRDCHALERRRARGFPAASGARAIFDGPSGIRIVCVPHDFKLALGLGVAQLQVGLDQERALGGHTDGIPGMLLGQDGGRPQQEKAHSGDPCA